MRWVCRRSRRRDESGWRGSSLFGEPWWRPMFNAGHLSSAMMMMMIKKNNTLCLHYHYRAELHNAGKNARTNSVMYYPITIVNVITMTNTSKFRQRNESPRLNSLLTLLLHHRTHVSRDCVIIGQMALIDNNKT